MSFTIFANIARPAHNRVGIGKHNQPEVRASIILQEIQKTISKVVISFDSTLLRDVKWLENIHDAGYLAFLEDAYPSLIKDANKDWIDETGGLVPNHFTRRKLDAAIKALPTYKLSGYYGTDFMSPIYSGTFQNAMLAATQSLRAAEHAVVSGGVNYALTCSPGHHAKYREYGGYCFINNAAVAAYKLSEGLVGNIGVLDLDYHHGSTTIIEENEKFRSASGVGGRFFVCSIHGSPTSEYPTFEGHMDQSTSQTLNIPLDGGTTWESYAESLKDAIEFLQQKKVVALVIAFGADTFHTDPDVEEKHRFALTENDYGKMGAVLRNAFAGLPIVVTQEGGYDMQSVGKIVCQFLGALTNQI